MVSKKVALVLGATGGIGGEVARQLRDAGWQVRALRRGLEHEAVRDGITWMGGDALNRDDVTRAARGAAAGQGDGDPGGPRPGDESREQQPVGHGGESPRR